MKGSTYFVLAILLLMIVTIVLSIQTPSFEVRLLPLVIGITIAVCAIVRLFLELKGKPAEESPVGQTDVSHIKAKPIITFAVWFLSFFLMIYLLGFVLAIFLFVSAYVKAHGKIWIKSLLVGLGTAATIYVAFDFLLEIDLAKGVLFTLLYRHQW